MNNAQPIYKVRPHINSLMDTNDDQYGAAIAAAAAAAVVRCCSLVWRKWWARIFTFPSFRVVWIERKHIEGGSHGRCFYFACVGRLPSCLSCFLFYFRLSIQQSYLLFCANAIGFKVHLQFNSSVLSSVLICTKHSHKIDIAIGFTIPISECVCKCSMLPHTRDNSHWDNSNCSWINPIYFNQVIGCQCYIAVCHLNGGLCRSTVGIKRWR